MNQEFFDAVQLMAAEKGIPVEFLYEKIANALVVAEKRNYNGKDVVFCDIDPEKKELNVYLRKNVVDVIDDEDTDILVDAAKKYKKTAKPGDIIEIPLDTKNFGRIDAQTAKHVIRQGIRDAERGRNMEEFKTHNQEIVTARVSNINPMNGNATVEIGRAEAFRRASRSPAKSCMTATSSRSMSSMSRRPRRVPALSFPEPTTVWSAGSSRPKSPKSPRAWSKSRKSPVRPAPVRRSLSSAPMRKSTPSAPASVPAVPVSARSSTC